MGNSFGKIFKLTTFGESHGEGIGGVIDGCPAGLELNLEEIQNELNRRKPGQSKISTPRSESDSITIFSGVFEGKTTGTPIGFFIKNKDQKPKDYSTLKEVFRPSHADYTYQNKYGLRDYRGGGRSSARETACRVVAGAIAKQILAIKGIFVSGYVDQIGKVSLEKEIAWNEIQDAENNNVRCPDQEVALQMEEAIHKAKDLGDSLGGVVTCVITGAPVGLGEPVFDKFNAVLGQAVLSINAVKGFEIGSGFDGCSEFGSHQNDEFEVEGDQIKTKTNNSGGIQGGLTNGAEVRFKVGFKPTATISKNQNTINTEGENVNLRAKGRHDPCVVPRAVPIVEAMAAMVTLDFFLRSKTDRLDQL